MSDSANPFSPTPPPPSRRSSALCIVASSIAVVSLLAAAWIHRGRSGLEAEVATLRSSLAETVSNLTQAQLRGQSNQSTIQALEAMVAKLERERQDTVQSAKRLEDEMRAQLESKDVTISELQGKLTVTIVDRVMFDSGEATLKPDGAAVMQKIATLLTAHPELKIHVIGHTDNVPIKATAQSRFASNWELSSARALAAVHFLTEKAGIDSRRVGAVGYGEFRPVADNATSEGRAKNRRIAVTILPDELLGAAEGKTGKPPLPSPGTELKSAP